MFQAKKKKILVEFNSFQTVVPREIHVGMQESQFSCVRKMNHKAASLLNSIIQLLVTFQIHKVKSKAVGGEQLFFTQ